MDQRNFLSRLISRLFNRKKTPPFNPLEYGNMEYRPPLEKVLPLTKKPAGDDLAEFQRDVMKAREELHQPPKFDVGRLDKLHDSLTSMDQNEPWYVIRFVDPSKEPEEVEEGVEEPWTRYYCEADLVRTIEAAESFDKMEGAISVSQILQQAKLETSDMLELGPEVFLKMRLIGQARIDMSTEYVPLVFDDTMIIQVVKVTETDVGYNVEVFWQDDYKWIWFEEEPGNEDDEESDGEPGEYPVDMAPYR